MPNTAPAQQKQRRIWLQYLGLLLFLAFVAAGNLTTILTAVHDSKQLRMHEQAQRQAADSANAGALMPDQSRLAAPATAAAVLQLPRLSVGVLSFAANSTSREASRQTGGSEPVLTASNSTIFSTASSRPTLRQQQEQQQQQQQLTAPASTRKHLSRSTTHAAGAHHGRSHDAAAAFCTQLFPQCLQDAPTWVPHNELLPGPRLYRDKHLLLCLRQLSGAAGFSNKQQSSSLGCVC
jgi:hypothetical protein